MIGSSNGPSVGAGRTVLARAWPAEGQLRCHGLGRARPGGPSQLALSLPGTVTARLCHGRRGPGGGAGSESGKPRPRRPPAHRRHAETGDNNVIPGRQSQLHARPRQQWPQGVAASAWHYNDPCHFGRHGLGERRRPSLSVVAVVESTERQRGGPGKRERERVGWGRERDREIERLRKGGREGRRETARGEKARLREKREG